MNSNLARLQETLRAIELGHRLESVDGVLVKQVLGSTHPKHPGQHTGTLETRVTTEERRDVYRTLVALQKERKRGNKQNRLQTDNQPVEGSTKREAGNNEPYGPALVPLQSPSKHQPRPPTCKIVTSPHRKPWSTRMDTENYSASNIKLGPNNSEPRGKLIDFQLDVSKETTKLMQVLSDSASILPPSFLFERNLSAYCRERAVHAVKRVLLRFQNRFFLFYWGRWVATILQLRALERKRAAGMLVRVYRGHQARKLTRQLRLQQAKLEAQRLQVIRLRQQYRTAQARRIQIGWRRYKRRQSMKQQQTAAQCLQQRYRDRRLRANQLVNTIVHCKEIQAAIRIQKVVRGRLARKIVTRMKRKMKREALVTEILARNSSRTAIMAWKRQQRGAGFLIAHTWIYPFAVRRRFWKMSGQLRRLKAGRVIFKYVAKWWSQKCPSARVEGKIGLLDQFHRWLELLPLDEQQSRRQAAVLIQKNIRRWIQENKYLVDKATRERAARKSRIDIKRERLANSKGEKVVSLAGIRRQLSSSIGSTGWTDAPSTEPRFMRFAKSIQPRDKLLASSNNRDDSSRAASNKLPNSHDRASSVIQRNYQRYRAKMHAQRQLWREKACKVDIRVSKRRQSAIRIQSAWRGYLARFALVNLRAERTLRIFIRRWKLRRSAARACAANRIAKWYYHACRRRLAHIYRLEQERRAYSRGILQRWARFIVWKRFRLYRILAEARRLEEAREFGRVSLQLSRRHLRDSVLARSIQVSIEPAIKRYLSQLQGHTPQGSSLLSWRKYRVVELPIVQLVFVMAATGVAYSVVKFRELSTLNPASSSVVSMLQARLDRSKALQFFKTLNRVGLPASSSPKRSPGKKAGKKKSSLLFGPTDVDLCLAKVAGASKSALTFAEFVRVLSLMADLKASVLTTSEMLASSRHDEATTRIIALVCRVVLADVDFAAVHDDFEIQLDAELDAHARCLQRLARRRANKLLGAMLRANAIRDQRGRKREDAAIRIQKHIRRMLAYRELRKRVMKCYEKYVDPDWGLPYWMNPRTGYSTWRKPAVLKAEDISCEVVPFPPLTLTLKIPCHGRNECARCAEWLCYDCDEFFCAECLPEFHTNKTKAKADLEAVKDRDEEVDDAKVQPSKAISDDTSHKMEHLDLCGLCQFQLASRRCLDCVAAPKTKQRQQQQSNQAEREKQALFCDVCFAFLHRRGALQMHSVAPLLELCKFCVSDILVVDPQPDKKVANAVQWECQTCDQQRVCGSCAVRLHPIENCGELKRMSLQTNKMVERAERLKAEQEARDRADVDKRRERAELARRDHLARVIQRFWRNNGPVMRARRVLATRRRKQNDQWKQLQLDRKKEKTIKFRAQAVLGMAPVLPSDSDVQKRLRTMNSAVRRRMRLRARAFGVLLHEYMTVGVPLPGLARLVRGNSESGDSDELMPSEDLRGWVKNRQTLRIVKIPKDVPTAEKYLYAWTVLARWGKHGDEENRGEGVLLDIGAKVNAVSERSIVLASPFPRDSKSNATHNETSNTNVESGSEVSLKKRRKHNKEDEVEQEDDDFELAMFLVEFSLDPKRTVWIDHSL